MERNCFFFFLTFNLNLLGLPGYPYLIIIDTLSIVIKQGRKTKRCKGNGRRSTEPKHN